MCRKSSQSRIKAAFCFINGTRGVISLFLAILMVPFVSIAGALINAARINSAVAVFDEALCNASNSTLGTYDSFLKKRFGLLAMAQSNAPASSYTGQDLIAETFQYYMEQNLGVLSNTYTDAQSTASGVYPLSDPDVLLVEVLEFSKYMVPAQLVRDGFSIDNLLKELTKSTKIADSVLKSMSAKLDLESSFLECDDTMKALLKSFDSYQEKKKDYQEKYSAFQTAVTDYNNKVTEMKEEVGKCEQEVEAARAAVATAGEGALAAAMARLTAAEQKLAETIEKYHQALIPLRNTVENKKSQYVPTLKAMSDAMIGLGDSTVAAQNSVTSLNTAGTNLVSSVADTVITAGKDTINKNIEGYTEQKAAAQQQGNAAEVTRLEGLIAAEKEKEVDASNTGAMKNALAAGESEAVKAMNKFAVQKYHEVFREHSSEYQNLYVAAGEYKVTAEDEYMGDTAPVYKDLSIPLQKGEVETLLSNLQQEVAQSSFLAALKALVGFIQALFTFNIWFDPFLSATVSSGSFQAIGGLPSKKTAPSSEFEAEDKAASERYRQLMGGYVGDALTLESVSAIDSIFDQLQTDIHNMSQDIDQIKSGNLLDIFLGIAKLIGTFVVFVGHLILLIGQLLAILAENIYKKILLAGYIGYNTANRTTYTQKALTGQSFGVPPIESDTHGLAFYGAETEYIIMGGESEIANQTWIYHIVLLMRLAFNVPAVLSSGEVRAVASAAGAPTAGAGMVIVYILYVVAESFADTLLLVNGGEIPIIKTTPYLTPSGILDFAGEFSNLSLNDAQKAQVNGELKGLLENVTVDGDDVVSRYESAIKDAKPSASGGGSKLSKLFTLKYTQMLILAMMFKSADGLLRRLGDVIQMEASYNALEGGTAVQSFDLAKSFTYLRASGSFSTNEFIRLSDTDALHSPNRVIYRGY